MRRKRDDDRREDVAFAHDGCPSVAFRQLLLEVVGAALIDAWEEHNQRPVWAVGDPCVDQFFLGHEVRDLCQVSLEDISRRNPDFILAGPIGKAQIESDPRWRIVRAARDNNVLVVDTLLVARPSVRLGEAAVSLANLLHPGVLR